MMLDYLGIFKKLNERKIQYIVVGGMAVNFHGIPRATYDIDLLVYLEDNNLKKFLSLMRQWGFKPKAPVDIMDFSDKNKRYDWIKNKNMKAFNLVNPDWAISEIDIIIDTPVDYKKAAGNINYIRIDDVAIPTISLRDLIEMKRNTGRRQDKADIRYLARKLRDEKN